MKSVASCLILLGCLPASGHRLDEYLQATTITLEKGHVRAQMYLTPGVAAFPRVISAIDTDRDGAVSPAEQQSYVQRVAAGLSLSIDGIPQTVKPTLRAFPPVAQMQDGLGEIQIEFIAEVPAGRREHQLILENRHMPALGAYLVNCLAPRDTDTQVTRQHRSYDQSRYRLDYLETAGQAWWPGGSPAWLGSAGVLLGARLLSLWRQRRAA